MTRSSALLCFANAHDTAKRQVEEANIIRGGSGSSGVGIVPS
jgi:hypothetical protein